MKWTPQQTQPLRKSKILLSGSQIFQNQSNKNVTNSPNIVVWNNQAQNTLGRHQSLNNFISNQTPVTNFNNKLMPFEVRNRRKSSDHSKNNLFMQESYHN